MIHPGKREQDRWAINLALAKEGKFLELDPQIQFLHLAAAQKVHGYFRQAPVELDFSWRADWFYGPPGTGKSRTARQLIKEAKPGGTYMKMLNKWWCNFKEDQGVILEDIDIETAKHLGNFIKVWFDIYPFSNESKQLTNAIRPDLIIATSNYHPFELWGHDQMLYEAIMRRIKIRWFGNEGDVEPTWPQPTGKKSGTALSFVPPTPLPLVRQNCIVPETPASASRPHFPIVREVVDVTNDPDPDTEVDEDEEDEE